MFGAFVDGLDGTVSVMTQSLHTTKNTELIGFAGD